MKLTVAAHHLKTMFVIERSRERGGFQVGSVDFTSIHSTEKAIFIFLEETMLKG